MRATLEKSAVVVWVKKTDSFKALKEQLASIAKSEPDESTEFDRLPLAVRFVRGSQTVGECAPRDFTQARNHRLASIVLR
jgi:hypothetical protein